VIAHCLSSTCRPSQPTTNQACQFTSFQAPCSQLSPKNFPYPFISPLSRRMSIFNCPKTSAPPPPDMSHSTSNPALPYTPMSEDNWDTIYISIIFAVLFLSFVWMSVYILCGRSKPRNQKTKKTSEPTTSKRKTSEPETPSTMESEYPPGIQIDKVINCWKKRDSAK
jgi:hypothetical protein